MREGGESKERKRSLNEVSSEEVGSPFVSMPTIPAVYLMGESDNQLLEKVFDIKKVNLIEFKSFGF